MKVELLCFATALVVILLITIVAAENISSGIFENRTDFIQNSDVNGDGITDRSDYNEIQKKLIDRDYSGYDVIVDSSCDVNGDGAVNTVDFLILKQQLSYEYDERMKNEAADSGIEYERSDGRILVWHDEFDGETLDEENWTMAMSMGSTRTQYVNDETTIRVEDGACHMIASLSGDDNMPYKNCMGLTTRNRMYYRYGYAEIKAILSSKKGTWQSWWLLGNISRSKSPWHAEIDIFESSAQGGAVALHKHHNTIYANSHQLPSIHNWPNRYVIAEDEYDIYHIYSFDWSEDCMIFAVDGEVYADFTPEAGLGWDEYKSAVTNDAGGMGPNTPIPGTEGFNDYVFFIFNNEFVNLGNGGSSEFGDRVSPEDMPIEYYLDYVRLWQNPTTDGICIGDDITEHEYKNGTKNQRLGGEPE